MAASFPIDFTDHHAPESTDLSARQREAFEQLEPEIAAVDPKTFITINIDIPAAVITVQGRLPRIETYRDAIAHDLPFFDITSFDKLEVTALALGQAHTNYLAASLPAEAAQPLAETLLNARDFLLGDATVLAKRQIIDGERLKQLQGTTGYKNIAVDVLLLCALFRDHWDVIAGRTAVKMAEIDRAEGVANRLTKALGMREVGEDAVPAAAKTRQAAFTLFMNRYDDVQRAITYLRWKEDDVDSISPSLYAGRNRKKTDAPVTPAPAPAAGGAPATGGAPPAPAPTGSPAGSASSSNATSNGAALPPAASLIGLPGDTPFNH